MKCHICNRTDADNKSLVGYDGDRYICKVCGHVLISRTAVTILSNKEFGRVERAKLSHIVRNFPHTRELEVAVGSHHLEQVHSHKLPTPVEQLNLLIRLIGDQSSYAGNKLLIQPDVDYARIGAVEAEGIAFVLEEAINQKLIINYLNERDTKTYGYKKEASYSLTFKGWEVYSNSNKGKSSQGYAFMAMKFGVAELDGFYEEVLKPTVQKGGYELRDVRETAKAGLIDVRMLVQIQNSDFVIADLSHQNNGAYWEAGYAHGLGKPVIYICEKSKFDEYQTHFDTNHYYTVIWDAENPNACSDELLAVIQNTMAK